MHVNIILCQFVNNLYKLSVLKFPKQRADQKGTYAWPNLHFLFCSNNRLKSQKAEQLKTEYAS